MNKHICGQCGEEFSSESDYLKHSCSASGVTSQQLKSTPHKPKVASLLEKKILIAVQLARAKKQYNA